MFKQYVNDLRNEFIGYNKKTLSKDLIAGLTVAAVALPLALAFGVSSGASASAGIITSIFAGIIIGFLSGASFQISGATGAMSAVLLGVSIQFGIEGVMLVGLLSGIFLLLAAAINAGKLISFIPTPVITGSTTGIALLIALGQINNLFGTKSEGSKTLERLFSYGKLGFSPDLWALFFGLIVIFIMIIYPKKWNSIFPSSLAGIIFALILNLIIDPGVTEVGSISKSLITKESLFVNGFSLKSLSDFITPAISITALGIVSCLMCGAAAGKLKGEKINSQRELFAQGIGNIILPLFGGIPATGAIARTSVGIKSGGQTRMTSVFHSLILIGSMFLLGGVLAHIPLSALAGLLMVTAWRMNDWKEIKIYFLNKKVPAPMIQFTLTILSTVIFDLAIAILIGVCVAMLGYMLRSCNLSTSVCEIDAHRLPDEHKGIKVSGVKVLYLSGPLFFGTQEKLTQALEEITDAQTIIISMRGVPSIDSSALDILKSLYIKQQQNDITLLFCGVQPKVKEFMHASSFITFVGEDCFYWDAINAIKALDPCAV